MSRTYEEDEGEGEQDVKDIIEEREWKKVNRKKTDIPMDPRKR